MDETGLKTSVENAFVSLARQHGWKLNEDQVTADVGPYGDITANGDNICIMIAFDLIGPGLDACSPKDLQRQILTGLKDFIALVEH